MALVCALQTICRNPKYFFSLVLTEANEKYIGVYIFNKVDSKDVDGKKWQQVQRRK